MESVLKAITSLFLSWEVEPHLADVTSRIVLGVLLIIGSVVLFYAARRGVVSLVRMLIRKTENRIDDLLIEKHVLDRLAHLAPAVLLHIGSNLVFAGMPLATDIAHRALNIYVIFTLLFVVDAILNFVHGVYESFPVSRKRPIKSYVQVLKIFLYIVALLLVLAVLLNRSPLALLGGIGALTAVLMLVFRDSLLGFVASVQIAANDMVREGDWIEVPKYGADGDVIDISLTTIKVQNWDMTITSIPSYALVQDSFKNWRGMSESGGRRIKRSLNIDMNSVKFCSEQLLAELGKIDILKGYLESKQSELTEYNQQKISNEDSLVNGRRLTNLGTFRAYVTKYLRQNENIRRDMTFLVRQLPPSDSGVPIEIYVFSKVQAWAQYEAIQADIFDHLLAVVATFELSVFQNPSGNDFRYLATHSEVLG